VEQPQIAAVVRPALNKRNVMIDVKFGFDQRLEAENTFAFLKLKEIGDVGSTVIPAGFFNPSAPPVSKSYPHEADALLTFALVISKQFSLLGDNPLFFGSKTLRIPNETGSTSFGYRSVGLSLFAGCTRDLPAFLSVAVTITFRLCTLSVS
jgi:hypothetical protein